MSNEQTFDLDNQPGIRKTPIRRSKFKRLAEVLDLDPNYVLSIEVGSNEAVVTALLQTTDGAKALGGGHKGGYLKHKYEIPVVDDEEDMSPSEYYGPNGV